MSVHRIFQGAIFDAMRFFSNLRQFYKITENVLLALLVPYYGLTSHVKYIFYLQ
jgi:hypothetical protein